MLRSGVHPVFERGRSQTTVLTRSTTYHPRGDIDEVESSVMEREDICLRSGVVGVHGKGGVFCHSFETEDEEVFGPLLQVYRVSNFDEAIQSANDTAFGLSALSDLQRINFCAGSGPVMQSCSTR